MRATTYFRALLLTQARLYDLTVGENNVCGRQSFRRIVRQKEKFALRVLADLKAKDEYKAVLPVLCDALLSVIELAQNRLAATARED